MTARLVAILIAFLFSGVASAGSITLRTHVRVPAGMPLLLEDIAQLEGESALAHAWTEIRADSGTQRFTITSDEVRAALTEQNAVWADLTLTGSTCQVMPIDPELLEARAESRRSRAETERPHKPVDASGTVRAALGGYLCRLLDVTPERLKLEFDDNDAEFLRTPTLGRTVEVRPTGAGDRIPLRIAVYQGDRLIGERTIRAGVRILREAVVLREPVARGDTVTADAMTIEQRWLSTEDEPATRAEVVGAVAENNLQPGEAVMQRDVDRPVAIGRGDRVAVRCLSGGIVVRVEAYATESGRVGDLIELRPLGSRRGDRSFTARVEGPGLAVTRATPSMGGSS